MYKIFVQRAIRHIKTPTTAFLKLWARAALQKEIQTAELTIRLVHPQEMINLNTTYRHKAGTTNVLSFPFDSSLGYDEDIPLLGDIVICPEVVNQEALSQGKATEAHWAHIVIHGTLHLLGFDHEQTAEAERMESKEIAILNSLGFSNPYQSVEKGES